MELVLSSCRECDAQELLPFCCPQCCRTYCAAHKGSHACAVVPNLSEEKLQDRAALRQLASLFAERVLPELKRSGVMRPLRRDSKALACLDATVGGVRLLEALGWRVGPELVELDVRALDLRRSVERQMGVFQQLLGQRPKAPQTLDYLVVLDFEATCQEGRRIQPQEIIEFPCVLLDCRNLTVAGEFHHYVRPVHHPKLTPFCTQLTGITQEMVDDGKPIANVFTELEAWLVARGLLEAGTGKKLCKFLFVTCGDWDLKTALPINWSLAFEKKRRLPAYFDEWINLKVAFTALYPAKKGGSMEKMLSSLNLELLGRHHSGIDDARNIARVARKMLEDGYVARATSWRV
jgi:ERI1 exoribonuclease 3